MALDVPTPQELRSARKDAGLTQGEVAERADISQAGLSKIESGNNDPRLSTVARIAAVLNDA